MIKLICVVKRNPSLSVEEFHDHWRGRHARLISETPGVADRIVRYEQNHRSTEDYKRGGDFDGVAIQWFDSMDDFVAMVVDPEYQAHVAPDERELLDLDGLVWILTEEEEVVIPGPEERDEPGHQARLHGEAPTGHGDRRLPPPLAHRAQPLEL